jgi:hypothetical protein
MAEKYLYFRTVTNLGNDDQAQDSVCYPLSKLVGFEMGTFGDSDATADDDLFTIIFESLHNDTAGQNVNYDTITVNIVHRQQRKGGLEGDVRCFC